MLMLVSSAFGEGDLAASKTDARRPPPLEEIHCAPDETSTCSLEFAGITGRSLLLLQALLLCAPGTASAQDQDIRITLDSFGIGGSFRPGGWVPVQVELAASSTTPSRSSSPSRS